MTALHRKLIRDFWHMRGQILAISLVMACGVATYVMSLTALKSLQRTQVAYYERHRFADVFTRLKRAPNNLADRIAEIPGVARVETRVVEHVTLDIEGMNEPAIGRLISVPDYAESGMNALYLRSGRTLAAGRSAEVLVSEGFATAHRLNPGDSVLAVINGRRQKLRIVGIALSPEYIYSIRPGDILPDDKRFGVFWMGRAELSAAFDMQGAFNDVCISLGRGASEREVLLQLDRLTAKYGGLGAHGRADQPSHKFISNEINELRGMAFVVPTIFLAVAGFLLNIVLSRLVSTQREQIAALKAFGYTRYEVAVHYLEMAMLIVFFGSALGTGVGAWLGHGITRLYTRFFHFPIFLFEIGVDVVLAAVGVASAAAFVSAIAAVRRAASLPPAEAMRPEPPARFEPLLIERMGFQRWMSPAARMILRQLGRRPWKAALSCFGIALGIAVLILGSFMKDAIEFALETQFYLSQRYDLSIAFLEPSSPRTLHDVEHLPGVTRCEPFRSLSVRIGSGYKTRMLGLMGVRADGELFKLVDIGRRDVALPPDGIVLSAKLAEVLGVGLGDSVRVEVLEGKRHVNDVPVTGLLSDFQGLSATMEIQALGRMVKEDDVLSGAFLSVDPRQENKLFHTLKNNARVASVTVKGAAMQTFRQTIAENLLRMRFFNVLFASVIAVGVVYNSARISLAERSRELATLRVIGFTRREASRLLLGELAVLTLAAIPLGLLLGRGLAAYVILTAYDTELFRVPLILSAETYAFAVTVIVLAAAGSGLIVRRMVDRLDLPAVLKSKE